ICRAPRVWQAPQARNRRSVCASWFPPSLFLPSRACSTINFFICCSFFFSGSGGSFALIRFFISLNFKLPRWLWYDFDFLRPPGIRLSAISLSSIIHPPLASREECTVLHYRKTKGRKGSNLSCPISDSWRLRWLRLGSPAIGAAAVAGHGRTLPGQGKNVDS